MRSAGIHFATLVLFAGLLTAILGGGATNSTAAMPFAAAIAALLALVFALGWARGAWSEPPRTVARKLAHRLPPHTFPEFETVDPAVQAVDVRGLLKVRDRHSAEVVRAALTWHLFRSKELPDILPEVAEDVRETPWTSLPGTARVDRLVVRMRHGVVSRLLLLHPSRPSGVLVLYHEGHDADSRPGLAIIRALLAEGHAVVVAWMPLLGPNNQPVVELPGDLGPLRIAAHDQFKFLETEDFTPLRYFVEPVVAALNYAEQAVRPRCIAMLGFSGGGWTTTLCAALDPRIVRSYPVADSLPIFLRYDHRRDWGDWEQTNPQLCRIADYSDLHVLGASGGRTQLEVLNRYDSGCYAGALGEVYAPAVREAATALGGSFELLVDDTHSGHRLSRAVLQRILADLRNAAGNRSA